MHVWLVEDDDALRGSLAGAVAGFSGVTHLRSFRSGSACLGAAERGERCEVGLIDLGLPDMCGTGLVEELLRRSSADALIALTVRSDDEAVFGALRAGAVGYLLKDTSLSELESALRLVRAGGSPLSPSIGRRVVRSFGDVPPCPRNFGLTPREAETLDLLCSGASYREAGRLMGVAESTVQTYVKNVYGKLGATNKVEAVRIALETGSIPHRGS